MLNLSDAGMYQCVAENKHGIIYFSAELMVLGKVAFIHWVSPSCAVSMNLKGHITVILKVMRIS